jgi:predicted ArsR family transcriptional regulator
VKAPSSLTRKRIKAVGSARKAELLELLKTTPGGLSAREIGKRMRLSYTGAKDLCASLQHAGLLTTWRNPLPRGRPELLYRITAKAAEYFDSPESKLLAEFLDAAAALYGAAAPGKLAFIYFQKLTAATAPRIRGETTAARLAAIARWRAANGYFSVFDAGPPPAIVEHHQPLQAVFEKIPEAQQMELQMLSTLAGCELRREKQIHHGHCEIRFFPKCESVVDPSKTQGTA